MLVPNYNTCIVHGSTILKVKMYFRIDCNTTFFIKLDYEDDYDAIVFDYRMDDAFMTSWRDRLSDMISRTVCSDHRMAEIRKWEETLYYHLDSIIRRLRLPNSHQYRLGATFYIKFVQMSDEALEKALGKLDMRPFAVGPNNNNQHHLLKRVRFDDMLKQVKFDDDDDEGSSKRKEVGCPICFEDFRDGETLTHMPCSHTFHYSCITMWLPKHQNCPMCRFVLNWSTIDNFPLN